MRNSFSEALLSRLSDQSPFANHLPSGLPDRMPNQCLALKLSILQAPNPPAYCVRQKGSTAAYQRSVLACIYTSRLHPSLSPSASHTSAPCGGPSIGCSGCPMSQHTMEACSSSRPMPKPPNWHLGAMMYPGGTLLTMMFSSLADSNVSASCAGDPSGHSSWSKRVGRGCWQRVQGKVHCGAHNGKQTSDPDWKP